MRPQSDVRCHVKAAARSEKHTLHHPGQRTGGWHRNAVFWIRVASPIILSLSVKATKLRIVQNPWSFENFNSVTLLNREKINKERVVSYTLKVILCNLQLTTCIVTFSARMGNHAKRANVHCALWVMRAVFSISDLGPRRLCFT